LSCGALGGLRIGEQIAPHDGAPFAHQESFSLIEENRRVRRGATFVASQVDDGGVGLANGGVGLAIEKLFFGPPVD
jgi:hypothetical protein